VAIDDNIPESEALIGTLTRYLTSKGLSKDRAGVYALTSEDIHNIEQGIPSIIYAQKSGLALRYHTFLFGIHTYSISGNASGLSFLQRVVYWDAAVKLIAKKPLLGTGTGDVKSAFLEIYDEMETNLEPKYRNRAHNQFLSFFVSFGILGFLYFLSLFVVPVALSRPDFLYLSFLLIAFVACLTEDTLETQAGATIFSFFYGLFASREKMKS
jgi:O-antigen ligase